MILPVNTVEKSYLLFQGMGWKVIPPLNVIDEHGQKIPFTIVMWTHKDREAWVDLYHPKNMALSWKVLNWLEDKIDGDVKSAPGVNLRAWDLCVQRFRKYVHLPGYKAQEVYLDEVLEVMLDTGLVKVENGETAAES